MSYAIKYQGTFYDRHNQQWRVEVLEDGAIGDADPIEIVDCNFSWSGSDFKYEPIITSSLEVTIVQQTNYQWRAFLVTDETDYVVRLRRYDGSNWNTSPIWWTGYLLPDVIVESYTSPNTTFTFTASDGLSRLKNLYYSSTPDTSRDGFYTETSQELAIVLCKCLAQLRTDLGSSTFTVNKIIDWLSTYEGSHTASDSSGRLSPLDQTYVDEGAFISYEGEDKKAIPMWEVVWNIAAVFGARIFLAFDETEEEICWHIINVNDFDGTSINRSVHEVYDGTNYFDLLSQGSVTPTETITTSNASPSDTIFYVNANHEVTVIPANKEIITGWKPKYQAPEKTNNLIPAGEFEFYANSNLSDWNSNVSLKSWTASAAPNSYERVKHYYKSNTDPNNPNRYGVQLNSNSMSLTSASRTITDGFSGVNNLIIRIRAYYLVDNFNCTLGQFRQINETPRLPIEVRIEDGATTRYLYVTTSGAFAWKTTAPTGNEIIYIEMGGALVDYKITASGQNEFAIYPNNVQEFFLITPVPTLTGNDGDLVIEISQAENPDDSNNNTRSVLNNVTPTDETVFAVYEFVRVNLTNEDGAWGNTKIEYVNTNSNIKTSVEPITVETIIGDAVDGEGFNVGSLKDSTGDITSLWEWNGTVGGTDGFTIHRLLGQLIANNYGGTTIKLSGDFNTGNQVYPYVAFQLSDNSVTKDMFLANMTWNIPDDIATCLFLENRNTSASVTVNELHTEGEVGSTGGTGGNLATYVPPALNPNLDAG